MAITFTRDLGIRDSASSVFAFDYGNILVLVGSGDCVSVSLHLSRDEATQLRDALTDALSVATPADVQATVTLSDAEEAMARR